MSKANSTTVRAFERRLRKAPLPVTERVGADRPELPGGCPNAAGLLVWRTTFEAATTADVEDFMIFLLGTYTASTAAVRFKSLQQPYGWLDLEEWIEADPLIFAGRSVPDFGERVASLEG